MAMDDDGPIFWYLIAFAVTVILHFGMNVPLFAAILFAIAVCNVIWGFLELLPVRPINQFPGQALFKVGFGILLLTGLIAYYKGPIL